MDATAEVHRLRGRQAVRHRSRYKRSKLARYRAELVHLRAAGASLDQMRIWLLERRVRAHRSTIARYLEQLPELEEDQADA